MINIWEKSFVCIPVENKIEKYPKLRYVNIK